MFLYVYKYIMIKGGGVHLERSNFYNSITTNNFEDAFYKFIENATFKILTDDSISGITLTATLKEGITSPYVSVNPDSPTFVEGVNKILIKIMPSLPPRAVSKRASIQKEEWRSGILTNYSYQFHRPAIMRRSSFISWTVARVPPAR